MRDCSLNGMTPSSKLEACRALSAGCLPPRPLPPAQGYAWSTYNPEAQRMVCKGPSCRAYAVIECVKAGAQPLSPDSDGNVGCGNTGKNNIGSWNKGDGNWGSCNTGELALTSGHLRYALRCTAVALGAGSLLP